MNQDQLSYFRVQNFKCLKDISLQTVGQFNFIIGQNGIGKSSLLEALLFDVEADTFGKNLLSILYKYKRFNKLKDSYWLYYASDKDYENLPIFEWHNGESQQDPYKYCLQIRKRQGEWEQKYDYGIREDYQKAVFGLKGGRGTKKFSEELDISFYKPPLVAYAFLYAHELTDTYAKAIQNNKTAKKLLIESMKEVMPDLLDLEISTLLTEYPALIAWQENSDFSVPLAACGDSAMRAFRIFSEIIAHRNKRLMIDDIEASIHYEQLPNFLRRVFWLAQLYEVQLFVTTNSWLCLKAIALLLEDEENEERNKKMTFFKLEKQENELICTNIGTKGFLQEIGNEQDTQEVVLEKDNEQT